MDYKKILGEIKNYKIELDKEDGFSPREKEILLEAFSREVLSHSISRPIPKSQPNVALPAVEEKKASAPETFASLINRAQINQHGDYTLFATYHIVIRGSEESATVKEIVDQYRKAYLKPSNTNVYLANLTRKGLLMPVEKKEGKAAFTITRDGIAYVEEMLNNGK